MEFLRKREACAMRVSLRDDLDKIAQNRLIDIAVLEHRLANLSGQYGPVSDPPGPRQNPKALASFQRRLAREAEEIRRIETQTRELVEGRIRWQEYTKDIVPLRGKH
jgi:hypothetical protein